MQIGTSSLNSQVVFISNRQANLSFPLELNFDLRLALN
jgi:hypothetical protein